MNVIIIFLVFVYAVLMQLCVSQILRNRTCGLDLSKSSTVYEGFGLVEEYPWLGVLYYPKGGKRYTTSVVLVTKQIVVASASEIDKLPKWNFRAASRVVLGRVCGEYEIRVRDYTYHPEFFKHRFSSLALVQLDADHRTQELRPICAPFSHLIKAQFYAFIMPATCTKEKLRIYRMQYVNFDQCRQFYRRSGLSQESVWPTYTACARAVSGGRCVWRSGSVLAVKQNGRWALVGFSVYGPGCGEPARFIDYGMYDEWVRKSVATVGRAAITRLDDNYLVMRRSFSNMQRFGPCDPEETKVGLYTDTMKIAFNPGPSKARYNVTVYDTVEYSCVTFKARPLIPKDFYSLDLGTGGFQSSVVAHKKPLIRIKRWCSTPTGMCYGHQYLEIQFFVEVDYYEACELEMQAYGKEARIIGVDLAMKYTNLREYYPRIFLYVILLRLNAHYKYGKRKLWFFIEDVAAAFNLTVQEYNDKNMTVVKT